MPRQRRSALLPRNADDFDASGLGEQRRPPRALLGAAAGLGFAGPRDGGAYRTGLAVEAPP